MPESMEVTLARIDERTKNMDEKLEILTGHNAKQDNKIESLERWRTGIVGGVTALVAFLTLLIKFGA